MKRNIFLLFLLIVVGCDQKVPSSFEVHYRADLKDSIVFVNYNVTSKRSINFYMDYPVFEKRFNGDNYDKLYAYHRLHSIKNKKIDYTTYRRKEFYFNNNPDSAQYYQSGGFDENKSKNEGLKPSNSYIRPARPYSYKK